MEFPDEVSPQPCGQHNVTNGQETPLLTVGPFETVMAACQLALCCVIIVSNSLTLVALATTKVLRTLQLSIISKNKFIVSLTAADLMVGLALLILRVQNYIYRPQWLHCQYVIAVLYSSINFSMFTMLTVALDRYLYIIHPFTYRRIATPGRVNASICLQWFFASTHGFTATYAFSQGQSEGCNPFNTLQRKYVNHMYPVWFFVLCVVISITYGLVARTAKKHHDRKLRRRIQVDSCLIKNSAVVNSLAVSCYVGETHREAICGPTRNQIQMEGSVHAEYNEYVRQIATIGVSQRMCVNAKEHLNYVDSTPHCHDEPPSQQHAQNETSALSVEHKREPDENNVSIKLTGRPSSLKGSAAPASTKIASFKWLKQMLIVFGLFVICWTPSMVCVLISQTHQVEPKLMYVLSMFGVANSAVNVYVYSMHTNGFRKAIRKRIMCVCAG